MTIIDEARIKVVQTILLPQDVVAVNVYYFKAEFAEDQADATVGGALKTWIQTLYGNLGSVINGSVALSDMYCYKWVMPNWELFSTQLPTDNFVGASELLPHGVAGLVRAYTERPTTIGRKYIPGLMEDGQDSSVWSSAVITALTNFALTWDNMATIDGSNGLRPGVFSSKTSGIYTLTGEYAVLANAAYQRRRRPGAGT